MKKTIAQQLEVTDFPFIIKDSNGNRIYYEDSNGFWTKYKNDSKGDPLYRENSNGYCEMWERDSDGNERYYQKLLRVD